MSSVKRMIERSLLMSESRWLLNHRTHTADSTWFGSRGFEGELEPLSPELEPLPPELEPWSPRNQWEMEPLSLLNHRTHTAEST